MTIDRSKNTRQYQINISVDIEELIKSYTEGHDIERCECPDVKQMVESELNWLSNSGIRLTGEIQPVNK